MTTHRACRIALALGLTGIALTIPALAQTVIPGARVRVVDVQRRTAVLTGELVRMAGDTVTISSATEVKVYSARIEATAGLLLGEVIRIDSAPFETPGLAEAFARQVVEANFQAGRGVPSWQVREAATSPRNVMRQSTTVLVEGTSRMEVSRGRHHPVGKSLWVGAVAGGAWVGLMSLLSKDSGQGEGMYPCNRGCEVFFGAVGGALTGLVVAAIGHRQWVPAPATVAGWRPLVTPTGAGIGLGLRIPFGP